MASEYICTVIPVAIRPNRFTDEFAHFGVILFGENKPFYGYKLASEDEGAIKRIVDFFPHYGRANLMRAMAWAKGDIEFTFGREKTPEGKGAFANLIRPRENVLWYRPPRTVITENPESELEHQYSLLVGTAV